MSPTPVVSLSTTVEAHRCLLEPMQPIAHLPYPVLERKSDIWPDPSRSSLLPDEVEQRLREAATPSPSRLRDAQSLAGAAIAIARSSPDDIVLAKTLHRAALILLAGGEVAQAHEWCIEAQLLFERLDDRWSASMVMATRARCLQFAEEDMRALILFSAAADRLRRADLPLDFAVVLAEAAMAQAGIGEGVAALAKIEDALRDIDAVRFPQAVLRLRLSAARIELKIAGDLAVNSDPVGAAAGFQRARSHLQALKAADADPFDPLGCAALDTLACTFQEAADVPELRQVVAAIVRAARRGSPTLGRGLAWLRLAELRKVEGRIDSAIGAARRAQACFEADANQLNRVMVRLLLSDLLARPGTMQLAYECHAEATQIEQSLREARMIGRARMLSRELAIGKDQLETEQTLSYAQRMSNVGPTVASLNHRLNQSLASIRMMAETALELDRRGDAHGVAENLLAMQSLRDDVAQLTTRYPAFPAIRATEREAFDCRTAVDAATAWLSTAIRASKCQVHIDFDEAWVTGCANCLVRALCQILNNALDAVGSTQHPRITIGCEVDGAVTRLLVSDNGSGVSADVAPYVFRTFYSTKTGDRALGLGLSISRAVLRDMGGDITIRSGARGGATIDIRLRSAPAPHASRPLDG